MIVISRLLMITLESETRLLIQAPLDKFYSPTLILSRYGFNDNHLTLLATIVNNKFLLF